jgi:hypothetical protein
MTKPKRGDYVLVTYVDLAMDHGYAKDADIPIGVEGGWYVGYRKIAGVRSLVLERVRWNKEGWQPGWLAWPESIIRNVEVVRASSHTKS